MDGIDLFLSDVVMRGLSGPAVALRLRHDHRRLRVLLISGYLADSLDLSEIFGARFLQKPFNLQDLLRHVRELLGEA